MTSLYRILYVSLDYDGPHTGICEIEKKEKEIEEKEIEKENEDRERYWFKCSSGLNVEPRRFKIYTIPKDILELVIEDHIERCKIFGRPIKHGDKWNLFTNTAKEGMSITKYHSKVKESQILDKAELKEKIDEKSFSNYHVEQSIQM